MKKVHFIGSGYESVKFIHVVADTDGEAIKRAENWYVTTGQTFAYIGIEVDKFA